jgi:prevent-host-death family protein
LVTLLPEPLPTPVLTFAVRQTGFNVKSVPLTEAKDKLSALVDEADRTHEIIQITRHGRVAAVIISADDLDSLNETLHALRTPGIAEELAQADADYAAGNTVSGEELRKRFVLT